jgi:hypothetical protein
MNDRHAYLIIAYDNSRVLGRLIHALDDPRNDIYVHIDRKSGMGACLPATEHSRLYPLQERIDARWGDVSLVEVEFLLLKEMLRHGEYQYCHFLSDSDFPVKSQDYIHDFCTRNSGKEFIGYAMYPGVGEEIDRKVRYRHLFPREFRGGGIWRRMLRSAFLRFQTALRIRRNVNATFRKGCQWCSITGGFAKYICERKDGILKTYSHTFCPDEIFIQTACWNSEYRDRIYRPDDEYGGCLRFIKWKDGIIRPITEGDMDAMAGSDAWFARKFDGTQTALLDEISERL